MTKFYAPRPIADSDLTANFDCGIPTLNRWLRERARANELAHSSRSFVSTPVDAPTTVAGFYCLSASSLKRKDTPGVLARNTPDPIPVALIGRLGVDVRFAHQGLGSSLLQHAVIKAIYASEALGIRAIVVYANREEVTGFYTQFGFAHIPNSERGLYLLTKDAIETVKNLGTDPGE